MRLRSRSTSLLRAPLSDSGAGYSPVDDQALGLERAMKNTVHSRDPLEHRWQGWSPEHLTRRMLQALHLHKMCQREQIDSAVLPVPCYRLMEV